MSGLRRLSLPDDVGEGLVGRLRGGLRGARRAPVGGVDPWTGGERGERVRVHLGCRDLTNKHVNNNKQQDNNTHSLRLLLLSAGIPAPCLPSRAPPLPV